VAAVAGIEEGCRASSASGELRHYRRGGSCGVGRVVTDDRRRREARASAFSNELLASRTTWRQAVPLARACATAGGADAPAGGHCSRRRSAARPALGL